MTLWRRVTPTIVRVSLLSALLGTVATVVITGVFVFDRVMDHFQGFVTEVGSSAFRARCDAEPEGWRSALASGDAMATYDLARLPPPPGGPDPVLLPEIVAGAPAASRLTLSGPYGGVLLMRLSPAGPCSLVELRWTAEHAARRSALLTALVLAALGALLTGLLSALLVVRPLIARVQRLHRSASAIGDGYASAGDPSTDELGLLSRVLDGADERIRTTTGQLRAHNEQLQAHLADIAHDLKTPLTAVQLTLEQAVRGDGRALGQDAVTRCLDDCVYLAAMIDNLRVGTQLRDGLAPDLTSRAELGELAAQVVRRLGLLGRYRGIELDMARPDGPVWCACRPLVLERVIDNLVYNAVSHGEPGGHVAVLVETEGERFRLTVLDDGPGMAPDALAKLGQRFFRGDGADLRAPRGSGLGLGIVAEVCRRWGWDLRFEVNDPRGLRVVVSGPLARPPALEAAAA